MAKQNRQERVATFLTAMGRRELSSESRKYRKFMGSAPDRFYFVGHSGAVRVGKISSNSISITEAFWLRVEKWEAKQQTL